LLAAGIPSSIERQHYAFKNFKNYNENLWEGIYHKANKRCSTFDFEILGSDIDSEMVLMTKRNLRGLPISKMVTVSTAPFAEVKKTTPIGTLVCNPPYGQRIGDNIEEMYEELGDWFKNELKGYDCWVLSSNEDALKRVGLKPDRKIRIFNGDLECSFRKYAIFDGFRKEFVQEKNKKEG
jgi:putative N6-adenine-specific DNA methylase